jgi:hypothetical protein
VTAIVQDNIRRPEFIDDPPEKIHVALISDANRNLILLNRFAGGIDVDADDLREWTKVPFPQLERATFRYPDLDECHGLIHKWRKVPLVDWKIVSPLVNLPLLVRQKLRPQAHGCPAGLIPIRLLVGHCFERTLFREIEYQILQLTHGLLQPTPKAVARASRARPPWRSGDRPSHPRVRLEYRAVLPLASIDG